MPGSSGHPGRRERAKRDKRERIVTAARELFAEHGASGVTTQQIADRADVAIGTLFLYAASKAELLIMVQNAKFRTAIDRGLRAASAQPDAVACPPDAAAEVMALLAPVVQCVREQVENGRTYLHELVFGDPREPNRAEGLRLSGLLERGVASILERHTISPDDAAALARVVSAILHISTTATVFLDRDDAAVLADIRSQLAACLREYPIDPQLAA